MKPKTSLLTLAAPLMVLTFLGGCAQHTAKPMGYCQLGATNNVERLFAEASEKLQNTDCQYNFPEYREQLLSVAKGDPGPQNEARFAQLLRESINAGTISKRQGQELFSQYFDPEFYSVKSEPRSSCTSLRRKPELYAAMRLELEYKREGMLEILDDEERFRQAQRHYSDLNMVFDAVEVACTQEL